MTQVLILIGIVIILCIQFGIIDLKAFFKLFKSDEDGYASDEEVYSSRRKRGVKRTRKHRHVEDDSDDDQDTHSDYGSGHKNPRDMFTPLDVLNPVNKDIRGTDLVDDTGFPWKVTKHSDDNNDENDPDAIQRQIMEELDKSRYNNTQLTSMSM